MGSREGGLSGCGGTVNSIIKNCFISNIFFHIIFLNHAHYQSVVCLSRECDKFCRKHAWGYSQTKFPRGVWPFSGNRYPIYDQNLQYSLPYSWPDNEFKTLFMTWPLNQNPVADKIWKLVPVLRPMLNYHKHNLWRAYYDEKVVSSSKHTHIKTKPISWGRYSVYDQNGWKTTPFGPLFKHVWL